MKKSKWLIFLVSVFFLPGILDAQIKKKALFGMWLNEADLHSKLLFKKNYAYQIYEDDTSFTYVYFIKDTAINSSRTAKYIFLYSPEDTTYFEVLGLTNNGLSLFSDGKRYFYKKKR